MKAQFHSSLFLRHNSGDSLFIKHVKCAASSSVENTVITFLSKQYKIYFIKNYLY